MECENAKNNKVNNVVDFYNLVRQQIFVSMGFLENILLWAFACLSDQFFVLITITLILKIRSMQ